MNVCPPFSEKEIQGPIHKESPSPIKPVPTHSKRPPINGLLARFFQQLICLREMLTTKEPPVHGEGRGVDRLQDVMTFLKENEDIIHQSLPAAQQMAKPFHGRTQNAIKGPRLKF